MFTVRTPRFEMKAESVPKGLQNVELDVRPGHRSAVQGDSAYLLRTLVVDDNSRGSMTARSYTTLSCQARAHSQPSVSNICCFKVVGEGERVIQ